MLNWLISSYKSNDFLYKLFKSKLAITSTLIILIIIFISICAPIISPHQPFNPKTLNLDDAYLPPFWIEGGSLTFALGTDGHGRDILSSILYGSRISIFVGFSSVILSVVIGVTLGLIAGYYGGIIDLIIMRIGDIQLTFPSILVALLIDGIAKIILPKVLHVNIAFYVIIFSIGISNWVQYARTVRAVTLVEKNKEYVHASQVIGLSSHIIIVRHILRNVISPVFVIATIGFAFSILIESTLSFLGVGLAATQASLGTLIRIGNNFLFSGEWWIAFFPGLSLVTIVLSINIFGDWLRDALNPKLK